MEKMIDGHKIPETQKGLKYSWMRAETDDFSYYETFNSIEECIDDAHYSWENRVSLYEDIDENGVDEITGLTISRPVIVIGVEHDTSDQIDTRGLLNGLISDINEEMYSSIESFTCYDTVCRPRDNKKDLEDNFKKFIKDNFDIKPEHVLDTFYLEYDLLGDKWIKE